ncbi:CheR family methyltransferase [Solidesulfovibrio sp.]|uniref:CheR family methyltransferase n=1 Tax=Solidesulfovibrio sp. TaxID=2910990 RepID=UPI002B1EC82F|nr:CheR family methyltransferase [Solidesulfovibrio sp.]MEA4857181.1 CheR family methyltransferase [Solidesulfovibrio sp.]
MLDLAPFHALIRDRCGILIQGNREPALTQAVRARVAALGIAPGGYYARLAASREEFQELVNLLTVNETYFFREPEHIRFVVDTLAPRCLAARCRTAPVRILSAGCSSGEEPYSLVMALLDRYGEGVAELFSFHAADIDSLVLGKARLGRYSEFSFRNTPPDVRARYFVKDGQDSLLADRVKRLVRFHRINFLDTALPLFLHDCDIIFFRNVSIYFDDATRRAIQKNLAALLHEDGALLYGTTETLANDFDILPMAREQELFYFTRNPLALGERAFPPAAGPSPTGLDTGPAEPLVLCLLAPGPSAGETAAAEGARAEPGTPEAGIAEARRLLADKRHAQALARLEAVLAGQPQHAEAGVLRAHALLHLKEHAAAHAQARALLDADAWSVDALMLLGLAAKWAGRPAEAVGWFKQAVYARPGCWPAQYALADLHRRAGETALAQRFYRATLQLLEEGGREHGIAFLPLELPVQEIRFLCRHQLAKLPHEPGPAGQR